MTTTSSPFVPSPERPCRVLELSAGTVEFNGLAAFRFRSRALLAVYVPAPVEVDDPFGFFDLGRESPFAALHKFSSDPATPLAVEGEHDGGRAGPARHRPSAVSTT